MTRVYGWWIALPHRCFQDLISPDNQVMMMLHSHSLAIVHIMAFITCQDRQVRAKSPESNDPATLDSPGFLRWLRYFNGRIDRHHRPYNEWPQWVADQLEMDPSFFGHIA